MKISSAKATLHGCICFALLLLFLLGPQKALHAQQVPWINTYYENPYFTNASFAGYTDASSVYLLHQNAMAQFQGAPTTQMFFWDGGLKKANMALGVKFRNDKVNFIRSTGGKLSYAYIATLDDRHSLRLGLALGINQQTIQFDQIQAAKPTENILMSANQSGPALDGEIGIGYVFDKKLALGISSESLFNNKVMYTDNLGQDNVGFMLLRHYQFFAQYTHTMRNEDYALRPLISGVGVQGTALRYQFGTHFVFRNMFHIGAGYKTNKSLNAVAGVRIQDKFSLNYSLDYGIDRQATMPYTAHEILLGYSFIDIGNKQRVPANSKEDSKLTKTDAKQFEEIDRLDEKQKKFNEELQKQKERLDSHQSEIEKLKAITQGYTSEIEALIQNSMLEILNDTTSEVGKKIRKKDDSIAPQPTKTYYVVMGAFKNFNPAKRYEQVLAKTLNVEAFVIQNQRESFYLVCVGKIEREKEAFKELERLRANKDYTDVVAGGNIWLYLERKPSD